MGSVTRLGSMAYPRPKPLAGTIWRACISGSSNRFATTIAAALLVAFAGMAT